MSSVPTSSILFVAGLVVLLGLGLGSLAVYKLRGLPPPANRPELVTQIAALTQEIAVLNQEIIGLRGTVRALLANLAEDQEDRQELRTQNQRLLVRIAALSGQVENGGSVAATTLTKLRKLIVAKLTFEEVRTLADNCGVNLDDLAGDGLGAKVFRLVEHQNNRGQVGTLITALRQLRTDVKWDG
jgi:hypothetical protein